MEPIPEPLDKYIIEEYKKMIHLDKLETYANEYKLKWLSESIQNMRFEYSSIRRCECLNTINCVVLPDKIEYICAVFRIDRKGSSSIIPIEGKVYSVIIAILYISVTDSGDFEYELVTISPTFSSADGEYRHHLITFNQILYYYINNPQIFEPIEEHVVKQLSKNEIAFNQFYVIPNKVHPKYSREEIENLLNTQIDQKRIAIMLYSILWLNEVRKDYTHENENHLADGFKEAVFSNYDKTIYDKVHNTYDPLKYAALRIALSRFEIEVGEGPSQDEFGQKFIPLTIKDAEEINDISLTPWREVFFSQVVGDLVINSVTSSFPILGHWFIIQGNDKKMWDNYVSIRKLDRSEKASNIIRDLEKARAGTYIINPVIKKEKYTSMYMENFSNHIIAAMDFAEKYIVLADNVLVFIIEHLGRTLADSITIMDKKIYTRAYGPIYKSLRIFSKYLFEYIYALFNLNTKLGIIHGDLHLNNVTLFFKTPVKGLTGDHINVHNPYVIYETEDNMYIFEDQSSRAGIIDFSRAFISTDQLKERISEDKRNRIIEDQKRRLKNVIEEELSDFYQEYRFQLDIAVSTQYDNVLEVFQIIDPYKLTKKYEMFINTTILVNKDLLEKIGDEIVLKEEIVPLLTKINNICYTYFTTQMTKIFNNQYKPEENINKIILRECFKEFEISNFVVPLLDGVPKINLTDFLSCKNELLYSCGQYSKYPYISKFEFFTDHNIPMNPIMVKNFHNYEKYLRKTKPELFMRRLAEELRKNKLKRRGAPKELWDIEDNDDEIKLNKDDINKVLMT